MKKVTILALSAVVCVSINTAQAQSKKDKKKNKNADTEQTATNEVVEQKAVAPAETMKKSTDDGFTPFYAGTDYRIIEDVPGTKYPAIGDFMEVHLNISVEDSIVFDTRVSMEGQPAPLQLQPTPFKGDLMEALKLFTQGDSAQVRLDVDTVLALGSPAAPWMKKGVGQKMVYNIRVVSVTTQEEKRYQDSVAATKQIEIDDKLIQDYLAKNNVKANKTASGLYYKITRKGEGANAEKGKQVSVNYTGMLMNGEKFDSNVDPQFGHVQPFEFTLGMGNVIRGWDEGIALLNKGAKATLYIPSNLAYGQRQQGPKIGPNSILIFEVELMDIK